jgi:hypothetical protein
MGGSGLDDSLVGMAEVTFKKLAGKNRLGKRFVRYQ